jgi:predicted ester cyclase
MAAIEQSIVIRRADMTMLETGKNFFEACETGKGWEGCATFCHEGATFACQADALAEIKTLKAYAEWMKGLFGPIPNGRYELKAFAVDDARNTVVAAAVFQGTNTGPGAANPPTGKTVATDYVYVIEFDGPKIRHMTKVWNDVPALRALSWA